jgi:3-methylfumaryl-CoA hydratase
VLKTGRSGTLVFVTVKHVYETSRGRALEERQDLVYRELVAAGPVAESSAIPDGARPERCESVETTQTLLFRYSAVTFNGHRTHYDLAYATREEGYPGLVVHGPLQATYLLRLAVAVREGSLPHQFEFRALSPLFAGGEMTINGSATGSGTDLWVADQIGRKTMSASAFD